MAHVYDLSGSWEFTLDPEGDGSEKFYCDNFYTDTIELPSTTAIQKKGIENFSKEIGHLTEAYPYAGNAWYQKRIKIDPSEVGKPMYLYLERTRITTLWVNDTYVSTCDSLCTPHEYDITKYVTSPSIKITILVNNKDYKTKGGHLTSPDTQTNWNGITGKLNLSVNDEIYIKNIETYPCIEEPSVRIKTAVINTHTREIKTNLCYYGDLVSLSKKEQDAISLKFHEVVLSPGLNHIEYTYKIENNIEFWSEYNPTLYHIYVGVQEKNRSYDKYTIFGLRKFSTEGLHFYINNDKTFLRGKHDGLIFPLTGAAPTTSEEWLRVLQISKSYGINHYRFHTCCPPGAAFEAADLLGIYMEPELPFWGTITTNEDEGHNEEEFQFLIEEGERMLHAFGDHPSFVMMSLGNELWGSKEKLAEILRHYKSLDNRHLYTQGCNNFQWVPVILEEDDFFVGVRFSLDRRIRGSYAACDIPFGFVQAERPNTCHDYDEFILPNSKRNIGSLEDESTSRNESTSIDESTSRDKSTSNDESSKEDRNLSEEIDIQYGTGTKRVTAEQTAELIPNKPVISHEIGQYTFYPNFHEIDKYVGVLKARNLEVFKERLRDAGMLSLSDDFFYSTGKLAIQCYKLELEAAHRSNHLAGYQILDLQDFSGQGTALVGILDAFMDSKGLITPEEWKYFCSDAVIMAKFEGFIYTANEHFNFELIISDYLPLDSTKHEILCTLLQEDNTVIATTKLYKEITKGVNSLGQIDFLLPDSKQATKLILKLEANLNTRFHTTSKVENIYELWLYPKYEEIAIDKMQKLLSNISETTLVQKNEESLYITHSLATALQLLEKKQRVLLIPEEIKKSLDGFYCTDFWCYPMFRSISESVNKDIPVGTMGLYIDTKHPALNEFKTECYSTPQWYEIITASKLAILDTLGHEIQPIVQMIDNFERNHKLSLLFEANVLEGRLLICTSKLHNIIQYPEVLQFAKSIINYGLSDDFKPKVTLSYEDLANIFE